MTGRDTPADARDTARSHGATTTGLAWWRMCTAAGGVLALVLAGRSIGGASLYPSVLWTDEERSMVVEEMHGLSLPRAVPVPSAGSSCGPSQSGGSSVPTVVLFVSRGCRPCLELLSRLPSIHCSQGAGGYVVFRGPRSGASAPAGRGPEMPECLCPVVDASRQLSEAYGVNQVPTAFLVGPDGKVQLAARGPERCWSLLQHAL